MIAGKREIRDIAMRTTGMVWRLIVKVDYSRIADIRSQPPEREKNLLMPLAHKLAS
jgi:hypothetical protein